MVSMPTCPINLPWGHEFSRADTCDKAWLKEELQRLCPEYRQVFEAEDAFLAGVKPHAEKREAREQAIFAAWPSDERISAICDAAVKDAWNAERTAQQRPLTKAEYSAVARHVREETRERCEAPSYAAIVNSDEQYFAEAGVFYVAYRSAIATINEAYARRMKVNADRARSEREAGRKFWSEYEVERRRRQQEYYDSGEYLLALPEPVEIDNRPYRPIARPVYPLECTAEELLS